MRQLASLVSLAAAALCVAEAHAAVAPVSPLADGRAVAVQSQPIAPQPVAGQGGSAPAQQVEGSEALRVFLDCDRRQCDTEYLRQQITFVNWVRDPRDAQVHVLVTTRDSAAGREYTFAFIGQEEFGGDDLEHLYVASNTNTRDETRSEYAQLLRVGLLHYMAGTRQAERIEIRQARARQPSPTPTGTEDDPWDFWVFRSGFDGEFEAEQRTNTKNINGNFSATRTTEAWKIRMSTRFRYNQREFTLSDGRDVLNVNRDYNFTGQVVKSIGPHWGASLKGSATHNTQVNQDVTLYFQPGIEYNLFPYSESSRRQLTFTWELGAGYYSYQDVTLFGETQELLYDEGLLVNYDVVQPWGEISLGSEITHFFDDFGQYRAGFDGRVDFRVTRGLSFNVNGNYALIRNQRYLAAEDLTDEEILLERRQLATSYRYSISFGINYTFGSIYNNVVNPRFAGNRGDFDRFFR